MISSSKAYMYVYTQGPHMHRTVSKNLMASVKKSSSQLPPLVEDRLSIGDRLDAARRESYVAGDKGDADKSMFITVCKLGKGQHFVSILST